MDFQLLFRQLASRPRMFLPDGRYNTLVAFVEGCNAATEQHLLDGFRDWVAQRVLGRRCSFHWSIIVASTYAPWMLDESRQGEGMSADLEVAAGTELLSMIDAFLAEHSSANPTEQESHF